MRLYRILAQMGCDPIIAVDVLDERLALARSLGATHTVNARDPQLVDAVRRLAGGREARWCLEAAGFPEALRAAVEVLAPRGTACLVGSATRALRCTWRCGPCNKAVWCVGASRATAMYRPFCLP